MNTREKEQISLGKAISYFTNKQILVFMPVGEPSVYDFLVDDGVIKKVQCKYSGGKERSGFNIVSLRTQTYRGKRGAEFKRYKKGDFDLLFVYCDNGESFIIQADLIIGMSGIVLGEKYSSYKV